MLTIWRTRLKRDLMILFLVSVLVASTGSAALAWVADRYFGKAVNGLMGDGQYDLFLQVRSDAVKDARTELDRLIASRLPGTKIKGGPSLAGKSTFFVSLPPELRRRDVFEGLDSAFSTIPGWSGLSLLVEPRVTISAVHGGAQEMLIRQVSSWEEVSFAFMRGGNVEVVLKSPSFQKEVTRRIKVELARYRLVELRFPTGYTMEDALATGGKAAAALAKSHPGGLVRDVTLAGGGDDYQYLMGTLIEMKRFLGYYAAVVNVEISGDQNVNRGDQLVLQGVGNPLISGEMPGDSDVVVRVDSVSSGHVQGIIVRGDSRDVSKPEAYLLNADGRVSRFVGMAEVRSPRDELQGMLDQSTQLINELQEVSPEASSMASSALDKILGFSKLLDEARAAQQELEIIRSGLAHRDPSLGQARLDNAMRRLDRSSAELAGLSTTVENLKSSVAGLTDLAGRLEGFNSRLATISRFLPLGDSADKLLAATQALEAVSKGLSSQQDMVAALSGRLEKPLATVDYWREKVLRFQSENGDYRSLLPLGGEGRKQLDDLILATGRALEQLEQVNPAEATGALGGLASGDLTGTDLQGLSARLGEIRKSLPNLRDDEIGRSISVIEQYVGDQAYSGEKTQILMDRKLPLASVRRVVTSTIGDQVSVVALPVGAIQPDLRGEVFRLLGEVRTTIAALSVLVFGLLTFLLDQSLIMSALRRHSSQGAGSGRLARTLFHRLVESPYTYGALTGAAWFPLAFWAAGAAFPVIGLWGPAVIGVVVGLYFASTSERFNGVNGEEITAGEALGLPFDVIMREIVIPAGRPGLNVWLNRRRLVMR